MDPAFRQCKFGFTVEWFVWFSTWQSTVSSFICRQTISVVVLLRYLPDIGSTFAK
ncbi:hypothetical protein ZHAS_00014819 [Anopheles sinensis]|uniref:Uncharacterized protein n=1 Tax=Anopheles sinensis TaxID=74873 RepID=A0A084W9B8_ANOSI|nr:hypothetical protein ZHAS_00014819 [Anopheles sinensis]